MLKLLISVILCLTCCVEKVNCTDDLDNNYHQDFEALQEINTGYNTTNRLTRERSIRYEYNEATLQMYQELMCTLLFSAQLHMQLTKKFLLLNILNVNKRLTSNDVNYCKEAKLIVETLVEVNDLPKNELWLMYIYMRKVQYDFQQDTKKDNINLHTFVFKKLEIYTDNNCSPNNDFNWKSDQCVLSKQFNISFDKFNSDFITLHGIQENKYSLQNLIAENYSKGMKINFHKESLLSQLYFYNVAYNENSMFELLSFVPKTTDFTTTLVRLTTTLTEAKYVSVSAIKSLGIYQRTFIDILKLTILQITCKHLMYITEMTSEQELEMVIKTYIELYGKSLSDFVSFVSLENNELFRKLITYFESDFYHFIKNIDNIIEMIKHQVDLICNDLKCVNTEPMELDDLGSSVSFNHIKNFVKSVLPFSDFIEKPRVKPIDDTMLSIQVYMYYLKTSFESSYIFKINQSFAKMADEITTDII